MPTEAAIQAKVDETIRRHQTTEIKHFPYVAGPLDLYKQKTKAFGTPVVLVGRAILRPTPEQLTVIGNGEVYDIAFLFSRTEMLKKIPLAIEGQWIDVDGEMEWYSRRFKIVQVRPTGQTSTVFHLLAVLAMSLPGKRDG